MSNWKTAAIVALLAGMGGYGFYQQGGSSQAQPSPTAPPPALPEAPAGGLVGKPAPDWNIPATFWANTPRPITLKSLQGHVTLLEFWRTGCSHCQEAAPIMRELYLQYHPRGLQMVAIQTPGTVAESNPENNWDDVQAKVHEWKLPYPVAFDKGGELFLKHYQGVKYPTVLVLDRKGIVRYQQTGHDPAKAQALRRFIDTALKDQQPG